jgi:carboxymethylenebutenolidase
MHGLLVVLNCDRGTAAAAMAAESHSCRCRSTETSAMLVTAEHIDLPAGANTSIRCFAARPQVPGRYPGIVFFSDIFQLSGPMQRACVRLAGHGFVIIAPEIYRRSEPAGSVIPFDDAGRTRGLAAAARTPVAHFDADCRLVLDHLATHPQVAAGQLGAAGFCLGGHLAFRAALQADVKATTCFYPTGVHNGKLGVDADAGTLQRVAEIRGRLLLVWGAQDPHIPAAAREAIAAALRAGGSAFEQRIFDDAEHAFMRDEGPRFDPAATDAAFADTVAFFKSAFG